MILVDTGPLVALFDPRDSLHGRCRDLLRRQRESLTTTIPVLTESFHLLSPESRGSEALRRFIHDGGMTVWFMDSDSLARSFELMEEYSDHPMDLADASIVSGAEHFGTRRVLTIDRRDFETYRIRRGHRRLPFRVQYC